jgi:hypothetical protein
MDIWILLRGLKKDINVWATYMPFWLMRRLKYISIYPSDLYIFRRRAVENGKNFLDCEWFSL